MMDWSPQSPDIDPTEELWSLLEQNIDRSNVKSKKSLE